MWERGCTHRSAAPRPRSRALAAPPRTDACLETIASRPGRLARTLGSRTRRQDAERPVAHRVERERGAGPDGDAADGGPEPPRSQHRAARAAPAPPAPVAPAGAAAACGAAVAPDRSIGAEV